MKAVVKVGPGKDGIRFMDIPEPDPKHNEVKIEINTAGICGTDLHILKDEFEYSAPVIMGHEFSGKIVEVGKHTVNYKPGDRVISLTAVETCGHCRYCREGLIMLCDKRKSIGSRLNGAFAEYMVVPENTVLKVPDNVTLEEATLFEPLACVVRSVLEISRIKAGDQVLVSGPGTIGQLVTQVAIAAGAEVFVAGVNSDEERLKLAKDTGAVRTIVSTDKNSIERLKQDINEYGFDLVFECAGVAESAETCLCLLRKKGQFVQVGLFGKAVPFNFDLALSREIEIVSSFATKMSSWERAIRLMTSRKIDLNPLISDILPLTEWENGFGKALRREGYKILLNPREQFEK